MCSAELMCLRFLMVSVDVALGMLLLHPWLTPHCLLLDSSQAASLPKSQGAYMQRFKHEHRTTDGSLSHKQNWTVAPRRFARHKLNVTLQQKAPAECDTVQQLYRDLAGLVTPCTDNVQLGYTTLGRGLVATQDLACATQCLSVDTFNLLCVTDEPLRTGAAFGSAALSDWQLLHGDLPPLLSNYLLSSRADWFKRLVAWLLWLKRHGPAAWQLYVQLMPQEHEMASLMNFTPEERRELQCPEMAALADKERSAIRGLHDAVFSSSTGDLASLDLAPTFEDTLWAACMVNSRCFSDVVGREAVSLMVPCADMANHSMTPNAGYRLDPDSQAFTIITTQDVPAGQEILISYLGSDPKKSNIQLMKDYGFVLPGNTNDRLNLRPTGDMQPRLQAARLLEAAAQCPCTSSSSHDDTAAHQRRQQTVMKSLKPFVRLGGGSGSSSSSTALYSVTAQQGSEGGFHEKQQAVELLQQCQEQLNRHATSIQEDIKLVECQQAGVCVTSRVKAAVAARLERKQLIKAAVDMLQQYASMVG